MESRAGSSVECEANGSGIFGEVARAEKNGEATGEEIDEGDLFCARGDSCGSGRMRLIVMAMVDCCGNGGVVFAATTCH